MFNSTFRNDLRSRLQELREAGLFKSERVIGSPQGVRITVQGREVLNFCANNYLGLSSHPKVIEAAHRTLDEWGYGLSSVRFICGTQEIHKRLEQKISAFLGADDAILYAACFDANGGVFEPLMDSECAIITDALNHASLIDGIRLTKAVRLIYQHADMNDLEAKLKEAQSAKYRLIATDGVFSMDGDIADLPTICDLAEKYDALVLVDDSHATGFIGPTGRGTAEYHGVTGRIDLITTTFGKALGGASGGCTAGHREIIDWLRQKSRPYLFSNTLAPAVVGATLAVLDLLSQTTELRDKLEANTAYFRQQMTALGFDIKPGVHPITPVMLYDEKPAHRMADELLKEGIYVIGFSYPVVPRGQARIRVQISAAHEREDLDKALAAFAAVGKRLGVIR
ncbi:MAG: glycine C-acetyltransferase [candidate division KSB1 bacterium]|nr:glycine C-acetyltransferase [candidate division KSB1 bacterium]